MTRLRSLIEQPVPPGLGLQDLTAYQAHTDWLKSVVTRLEKVSQSVATPRDKGIGQTSGREQGTGQASGATGEVTAPRDRATGQASGAREANTIQTVLSPDVDLLRQAIEAESQKFELLSAVLKARHEAAMNAIRNMKG